MNGVGLIALVTLASVLPAANAAYYAPGEASWLGSSGDSGTPLDYEKYFPFTYVIFGVAGIPHIRSIVTEDSECPQPEEALQGPTAMKTRFLGNPINSNMMPYKFPVKVCEVVADSDVIRSALSDGTMAISYRGKSYPVTQVKSNPKRFLLTGDTGLRLKPKNLGLGELGKAPCDAPEVSGIHQCYRNFTESDLTQEQTGSYQGLDEWVFKDLADSAAAMDVDVVVYVGDYLYRQGPCPFDNTDTLDGTRKDCSAVNLPEFSSASDIMDGTTLNFIPGIYGDNWWGWWADFFYPAMKLLMSAPIIPTRGNHEICSRGGFGYFIFLSPVAIEDYCLDNFPPYAVKFEHEQFLVIDDSIIAPLDGGVDHYLPGECPGPPPSGEFLVPIQENRYGDPEDKDVKEQLGFFTGQFESIEQLSQGYDTNFYVGHRPLLGLGCNNGTYVTLDWTLQQSLGKNTLDRISGIITGHMHWLEVIQFKDDELPPQIVVGHGGTKLIQNFINQTAIPSIKLEVGKPELGISGEVDRGLTRSEFGFGIMERSDGGDYDVTFFNWNGGTKKVEPIDFKLLVRKGPRVESADTTTSSGLRLHASQLDALGAALFVAFFFFRTFF